MCHGASICEHNRRRTECKDCIRLEVYDHNRIWTRCAKFSGLDLTGFLGLEEGAGEGAPELPEAGPAKGPVADEACASILQHSQSSGPVDTEDNQHVEEFLQSLMVVAD